MYTLHILHIYTYYIYMYICTYTTQTFNHLYILHIIYIYILYVYIVNQLNILYILYKLYFMYMCVCINGIWFIFVYTPLSLPPRLVAFCMLLNTMSTFIPSFYASCEIIMSFVPSLLSLLFRVLMLTNTRHRV